jgi:hypothetical protein
MANRTGGSAGGEGEQEQNGGSWQQDLQEQIRGLGEQIREHSSDLADMAGGGIRSWPVISVAGALAVGIGIGLLLGGAIGSSDENGRRSGQRRR